MEVTKCLKPAGARTAAAAFSRIAVVTFVAPAPVVATQWGWVPALLFALSAALLWAIRSRSRSV